MSRVYCGLEDFGRFRSADQTAYLSANSFLFLFFPNVFSRQRKEKSCFRQDREAIEPMACSEF